MPLTFPNLRVEPDQLPYKLPFIMFYKKAKKKVPSEQERKTFQIIVNFQKVFGLDISYENKVPPIGDPNATLTPAEAPAAANCLLFSSFCNISNPCFGMYRTRIPQIAPICANGPSLPIQSLPITANVTPMILVIKVGIDIKSG
jgi:hypothetical protein